MSREPTLLVLGAGASAPYGFPVGAELVLQIYRGLEGPFTDFAKSLLELDFKFEDVSSFRDDLYRSNQPSVDAFLENRPEYLEVGKVAIARALIPFEDETRLIRGDWYTNLFNIVGTSLKEFQESNLSIVTFNYERSLEQFLLFSLRASFGLSESQAADLLRQLPIIHLHGLLGGLPYLTERGVRPYLPVIDSTILKESASQIRIIHEADGLGAEFAKAHELLTNAKRVCFLGFGYHPTNVARLRVNELFRGSLLLGTAHGLENAERNRAMALFRDRPFDFVGTRGEDSRFFIRSYDVF